MVQPRSPAIVRPRLTAYSNISAYRFVDLTESWIRGQRSVIKAECEARDLRGTILLSTEGVNVALSGRPQQIRSFWRFFSSLPAFGSMSYKESPCDRHVFNRMLVKIKEEIIPFGRPDIRPSTHTAPRISAETLLAWLDEGRDIVLLDTRNDYEVELGTFHGAIDLGIRKFRGFPDAAQKMDDEIKAKPVVTFCTGGVRCEKAAPYLEQAGFSEVYQLDGGILGYFEDCGGDHWDGECFVFDHRVAVDTSLHETDTEYCYHCQHILRPTDVASPLYEFGRTCPYCSDTWTEDD